MVANPVDIRNTVGYLQELRGCVVLTTLFQRVVANGRSAWAQSSSCGREFPLGAIAIGTSASIKVGMVHGPIYMGASAHRVAQHRRRTTPISFGTNRYCAGRPFVVPCIGTLRAPEPRTVDALPRADGVGRMMKYLGRVERLARTEQLAGRTW